MGEDNGISSYRKSFDIACSSFLKMVVGTYVTCVGKAGSENEFLETVYNPMLTDQSLDPKAMQAEFIKIKGRDYLDFLRLACAFQIAGSNAFDHGNGPKAWMYLCRANYHLGRTHRTAMQPVVLRRVIAKRSRSGASSRSEKYEPIRKHALSLVQGREHTFKTRNRAAKELAPQVLDFAKHEKVSMFATQMVNNLNRWFAEIEFGPKS